MSCPACGSDDWKTASLVYQEGLTNVDTATKSVGLGVGGGHVGVGIGRGKTKGIHQTALSKQAAPPQDNSIRTNCVALAVLTFLFGFLVNSVWILTGLFILGAVVFWKSGGIKREQQLSAYAAKRVCQRCGHIYYAIK